MIIVRDLSRAAYLKEVFRPAQLENVNQVSPLVVFLLVFVVGLLLLYYMIRLLLKPKTTQS
jgi:small-conductance mechanosensitive channel